MEKRYELADSLKSTEEGKKQHCIEDSTSHFIIKQMLKLDKEREKNSLLSKNFKNIFKSNLSTILIHFETKHWKQLYCLMKITCSSEVG